MSECSIHPSTPDKWIAFMRGSLAKTLAKLENRPVLVKEPAAGFTEKSCVLLALLDPTTSSWKMLPLLKATDLKRYSKTWPSWGMTQGGFAYAHPMSGHRITETGGLHWPTPTVNMVSGGPNHNSPQVVAGRHGINLSGAVQMWPTPNASDSRDRGNMSNPAIQRRKEIGKQLNLSMVVHPTSGKLNPQWVEWLMGWPIGHTDSKHWETGKSRFKSQSRLPSWLRSK